MNLLKEHYESIIKYNGFCEKSELYKIYGYPEMCLYCKGPKDVVNPIFNNTIIKSCSLPNALKYAKQKLDEIEKAEFLAEKLK